MPDPLCSCMHSPRCELSTLIKIPPRAHNSLGHPLFDRARRVQRSLAPKAQVLLVRYAAKWSITREGEADRISGQVLKRSRSNYRPLTDFVANGGA